jgi:hypothetical protein
MFHVLDIATGKPVCSDETGEPEVYETGALAAERAKALSEAHGHKFQPRPVPAVNDLHWRERERQRFEAGKYTRPNRELNDYCRPSHFVHVSLDKPALLAYTPSEEYGRADRQVRKRVSTYLAEFCPALAAEERDALEAEHVAAFSVKLRFAKTPGEIRGVYTTYDQRAAGVNVSCMRYDVDRYHGEGMHPTEVYGDSDLQVAYLTNDEGETTHRALIWPAKKVYSRVYGDCPSFHAALQSLGYVKSSGYYTAPGNPSLAGARVRAIELDTRGSYLMPYIDEAESVELLAGGEWFQLRKGSGGSHACHETDGTTGDGQTCDRCDGHVDEDDTSSVVASFDYRGRPAGYATWCQRCAENYAFYCEGVGETISDDVGSVEVDGRTYARPYAEEHAHQCARTDEYTFRELVTVITDASDGEEERWSAEAVEEEAFLCRVTGELYAHDAAREGTLERRARRSQGTYWTGINDAASDEEADEAAPARCPYTLELPLIAAE